MTLQDDEARDEGNKARFLMNVMAIEAYITAEKNKLCISLSRASTIPITTTNTAISALRVQERPCSIDQHSL